RYCKRIITCSNTEINELSAGKTFQIQEAYWTDNPKKSLAVKVKYGGGCRTHTFELIRPKQCYRDTIKLFLRHNTGGDNCRAFVTNELFFDIATLKRHLKSKIISLNNFTVSKKF
ncbi:MAG: hypothetical protein RMJ53_07785, partial [Chitinophagales bacterium]|nr:hypothetical protein [Chitinophagales bacterium]